MTAMSTAAFFDVDETLITVKSMFDFLCFHLEDEQSPEVGQAIRLTELQKMVKTGSLSRAEVNRGYYRIYRGLSPDLLRDQGSRWFEQRRRESGFIRPAVLSALVWHQLAGHAVVLVSGSFPACLDPLRATLGVHHLLCSRPLVGADGLLTGEIERPMIGATKAIAMRELAKRCGLSLPLSFGYADHASDLPLLLEVGHPAVVGSDPVLDQYVERNQWLRFGAAAAA